MSKFGSVDEVLDFAISREEEACAFYLQMAQRMEKPWMKQAFEEFANQELGHKDKLVAVKQGKTLAPAAKKIADLKIADYVVAAPLSPDMSYADALTVAMKREKKAFMLYTRLADACGVPGAERHLRGPGPGRGQAQAVAGGGIRRKGAHRRLSPASAQKQQPPSGAGRGLVLSLLF